MKVTLNFNSNTQPSIEIQAETDAEKAILAFLAEGNARRWKASPAFTYRAGGIEKLRLDVEERPAVE